MAENDFSSKIVAFRKAKGYTQAYVAKELGVTPAAVSKWENGSAKPRVEILFKLAQLLDVNVNDLLFQDEEITVSIPSKKQATSNKKRNIIWSATTIIAICLIIVAVFMGNTTVPDLTGMDCVEAEQKLNKLGLRYHAIGEYNETVPENVVITQSIEANSTVRKNNTVIVTVSKGKQPIPVPQVVGLPLKNAKKILEDLGFKVRVNTTNLDYYKEGIIIHQSISAGQTAYKGTIIYLAHNM